MSNSEQQNSDISVVEDFTPEYNGDTMSGKTTAEYNGDTKSSKTSEYNGDTKSSKTSEYNGDTMSSKTTDIAGGRKTIRPKIMLSAVVTCPRCGTTNKPEWVTKSRHGDNYATTMWCEQCGSLIAVWATHVEAQVVANSQDH